MELTMSSIRARERSLVWMGLALLAGMSWVYLVGHGLHSPMQMAPAGPPDSGPGLLVMAIVMWSVMMVAMMLPSAGPMIFTYLRIKQRRDPSRGGQTSVWVFVAGYLIVWLGFSLAAALLQWSLHENALLNTAMGHVGPGLAGMLLIVVGAFQFSRLKVACLVKCRSPLSFVMTQWRDGPRGALLMGIRHGAWCTGCCWALMLLMFVGGIMNLAWMAALAIYFLAEKLLPWPDQARQFTGGVLLCAGATVLLVPLLAQS